MVDCCLVTLWFSDGAWVPVCQSSCDKNAAFAAIVARIVPRLRYGHGSENLDWRGTGMRRKETFGQRPIRDTARSLL